MAKKVDISTAFHEQHLKNQEKYAAQVTAIFKAAANEAALKFHNLKTPLDKPFSFADYPSAKNMIDDLINTLNHELKSIVSEGVTNEWLLAAKKNDKLVKDLFYNTGFTKEQLKQFLQPNLEALQAFQIRKVNGLKLSDRVWKYTNQFKNEIEMGLDLGLASGKSAAQLSRDLRQYLQEPNKLFKRVKDKHGHLQLSKNARAYHPGQGVYRSSYKNAMRLTRTETNMAYHQSDFVRLQQLDFVVGIRIELSNNHTLNGIPFTDICDRLAGDYPKDYKFVGWHPQCRCKRVTILAEPEEFAEYQQAIMNGEDVTGWKFSNTINGLPGSFHQWIDDNKDRIEKAKTIPYFIKDNFSGSEISKSVKKWENTAKKPAVKNINEVKKQITINAQLGYSKEYANKKIQQAFAAGYEGAELEELQKLLADPKAKYSQIDGKASKLQKAIKKHSGKDIIPPAPSAAEAAQIERAVREAIPEPPAPATLRAQLEKDYTKSDVDALLEAYYKHIAKKESKDLTAYCNYLKYEINWINNHTLNKYKTSPKLKELLEKELADVEERLKAETAKAAKKAAEETAAFEKAIKSGKVPKDDFRAKAGQLKLKVEASKELEDIKKQLNGKIKPKPGTFEEAFNPKELQKIREMEAEHMEALTNANGDIWDYAAAEAEYKLNRYKQELAHKYHDKRPEISHLDELTEKEFKKVKKDSIKAHKGTRTKFSKERIKDWAKELGADEQDIRHVLKYTSNFAFDVNEALRANTTDPYFLNFTQTTNRALSKCARFEGYIRRGINNNNGILESLKKSLLDGTPWEDKGFSSGAHYNGGYNRSIRMRIKIKSGAIIDKMSEFSSECETLMRAGTKYRVKNIYFDDTNSRNWWCVEMEEL